MINRLKNWANNPWKVMGTAVAAFIVTLTLCSVFIPVKANAANSPLTVEQLNDVVDSSNFIVGRGCSGTLIDVKERLVLTAHHCVEGNIRWVEQEVVENGEVKKKKVEVRIPVSIAQKSYKGSTLVGASEFKADIVGYSDYRNGYDLALLQITAEKIPMTKDVPILPLGRDAVRGETIYVVGNPANLDATITKGIIASPHREYQSKVGNKVKMIQMDAEVFPGNSGGSLMSADGFYMGTISRGIPGTAVVFAMHYEHIRDLLKNNCYEILFNPEAKSIEDCNAEKKAKEEEAEKTLKDILKEALAERKAEAEKKENDPIKELRFILAP